MELINIKNLNERRITDLNKLGIFNCEDLINNYPRNYLDMRQITQVKDAYHNDFVLTVAKVEVEPRLTNAGRFKIVKTYCSQQADTFSVVWFNQPYVASRLKTGKEYFFYGRVSNKLGVPSMTNPVFEEIDKNYKLKGLVPVYSLKGNLTQSLIKSATLSAISALPIYSHIPENLQRKYSLMPLKTAYYDVHNPQNDKNLKNAQERIALEEYFKLITAFKIIKGDKKTARIVKYTCSSLKVKDFVARFGFSFTEGQKCAVNEIYSDLTSPYVMNRLLQGDVGSGKTAVALTSMYVALESGYQVAFLSPTEVLAKQNYELCKKYFKEFNVEFLSGSTTPKDKTAIKKKLIDGECHIVVGTHAIIQDDVKFKNLSLCVCDEQQRFGVAQRSSLENKGASVDMLVMSATPIPRTLSLVFYGDLDVSSILDKPVSRKEIKTGIVVESKYEGMLKFIENEIQKGRQAYFVCPKIEGDEEGSIISVKETFEELKGYYYNRRVALLHGKMKDAEKTQVMSAFKNGEYDILVSTTVIEVGVDVPNATIMVIYSAERFGLSQLHQLRGRIGRSDLESFCFLIITNESATAKERLSALKNCSNGFQISEIDYDMRGGGDFLGQRQSGKFISVLGNLKYPSSVIFFAKGLADEAFLDENNVPQLKKDAVLMYEKLKNITLN